MTYLIFIFRWSKKAFFFPIFWGSPKKRWPTPPPFDPFRLLGPSLLHFFKGLEMKNGAVWFRPWTSKIIQIPGEKMVKFSNFPTFQCWWAVIWGTPCSPRHGDFSRMNHQLLGCSKKNVGNLGFSNEFANFLRRYSLLSSGVGGFFAPTVWFKKVFDKQFELELGLVTWCQFKRREQILNQSEDSFATAVRKHSTSRLQPKYNLKTSQEEIRRHLAIPANKDHCSKEIPRIWNWLSQESPGPTIEFENFGWLTFSFVDSTPM